MSGGHVNKDGVSTAKVNQVHSSHISFFQSRVMMVPAPGGRSFHELRGVPAQRPEYLEPSLQIPIVSLSHNHSRRYGALAWQRRRRDDSIQLGSKCNKACTHGSDA